MKVPKSFLLIALVSAVLVGCKTTPNSECEVDPQIFCEPYKVFASELPDAEKKELAALPLDKVGDLHFGLGMGVRNRFGLHGNNELTRWFRSNGVDHSDSMSTPFIEGFVLYLRGEPVHMREIIKRNQPPPIELP